MGSEMCIRDRHGAAQRARADDMGLYRAVPPIFGGLCMIDWLKVQGISAYTAFFGPTIAGVSGIVFGTWAACLIPLSISIAALLLSYFAQDMQDRQWCAGEAERDRAWCEFMRRSEN